MPNSESYLQKVMVLFTLLMSMSWGLPSYSQDPDNIWTPSGWLKQIPVQENCARTGGDIAVALSNPQPVIYYCQRTADKINSRHPGAGHFYYVHEYGHHALSTSSEAEVDCWAADQLADVGGQYYLEAAIRHFRDRGDEYHPRYGTMNERAERIIRCAGTEEETASDDIFSQDNDEVGRSCCMGSGGKCGPFWDQKALPLGSQCMCDYDNPYSAGNVCRP